MYHRRQRNEQKEGIGEFIYPLGFCQVEARVLTSHSISRSRYSQEIRCSLVTVRSVSFLHRCNSNKNQWTNEQKQRESKMKKKTKGITNKNDREDERKLVAREREGKNLWNSSRDSDLRRSPASSCLWFHSTSVLVMRVHRTNPLIPPQDPASAITNKFFLTPSRHLKPPPRLCVTVSPAEITNWRDYRWKKRVVQGEKRRWWIS